MHTSMHSHCSDTIFNDLCPTIIYVSFVLMTTSMIRVLIMYFSATQIIEPMLSKANVSKTKIDSFSFVYINYMLAKHPVHCHLNN